MDEVLETNLRNSHPLVVAVRSASPFVPNRDILGYLTLRLYKTPTKNPLLTSKNLLTTASHGYNYLTFHLW